MDSGTSLLAGPTVRSFHLPDMIGFFPKQTSLHGSSNFLSYLWFTCFKRILTSHHFQPIITEINHAIGAEGVVSAECKEVVSQYGDLIWELLISGVRLSLISLVFQLHFHLC